MDLDHKTEIVQYQTIEDSIQYRISNEEIPRRPFLNPYYLRKEIISRSIANFGYELNQHIKKTSKTSQLFSPLSLYSVLGMILKAMPEETRYECLSKLDTTLLNEDLFHSTIMEILKDLESTPSDPFAFQFANGLAFAKQIGIFPSYKKEVSSQYLAETFEIDQDPKPAADMINEWVDLKTNGQINNLVKETDLDPLGSFAILNAIYFEALWENEFEKTKQEPFYLSNGKIIDVEMMSITKSFPYFEGDGFKMVEIPYKSKDGQALSHLIFLPNPDYPIDLLEEKLSFDYIQECKRLSKKTLLDLKMPKVNLEVRLDSLLEIFEKMGLKVKGELPFIAPNAELIKILHQAKMKTDEKGTKAAAATAAIGICKAYPQPVAIPFIVNQNYSFYILDNDFVLFQGNVKDESAF